MVGSLAQILISLCVYLTYPLMFYVPVDILMVPAKEKFINYHSFTIEVRLTGYCFSFLFLTSLNCDQKYKIILNLWVFVFGFFWIKLPYKIDYNHSEMYWYKVNIWDNPTNNIFIPIQFWLRVILVMLTFLFAILIPHIDLFIALIGALASSSLALIFPPMVYVMVRIFTIHYFLPKAKKQKGG